MVLLIQILAAWCLLSIVGAGGVGALLGVSRRHATPDRPITTREYAGSVALPGPRASVDDAPVLVDSSRRRE